MCFGNKSDADAGGQPPRPVSQTHQQPHPEKASVPAQYQSQHQQQQQQPQQQYHQQQPAGSDFAPPAGPPPGHGQYAPPAGPPPGHGQYAPPSGPPPGQRHDEYAPPAGPPPGQGQYAPPAGPPPGHGQYAPPSGPPPGQRHDEYAPPSGPPPGQRHDEYAPPAGPPPGQRYDEYAPPSGPPPGHGQYAPPAGPPPGHGEYAPPAGPPPGQSHDYAPPSGPPPSHRNDYAPPSGPPPSHNDQSYMAPPPGPPPSHQNPPKPQHDWETLVPDTALFPPPPSFFSGWDRSPANNSTEAEAEAGEAWCAQYALTAPLAPDGAAAAALREHNPRLMQPEGFRGRLECVGKGVWRGATERGAPDSTIIAYPPLYTVTMHSPLTNPSGTKTVYYELHLLPAPANPPTGDVCLALGFTALPYPSFRLPGWHRGSLAVHGDDGHRFVNDVCGGKSFTDPFVAGETLGVGMVFRVVPVPGGGRIETEVFFTRQGREVGRWNLHEETDAERDLPVTGLEGYHDLSCAIGTCGLTGFEVVFDPARWLYRPAGYY